MNPRLGGLAVMNGDIEFTTTSRHHALRGIIQGLPLKFVAISVRKTDHFLISRPELKTIQDSQAVSASESPGTPFGNRSTGPPRT